MNEKKVSRMKKVFDIYDNNDEPILSFDGYDYVPEIGTTCLFEINSSEGALDIVSDVVSYTYIHSENKLVILCRIEKYLEEWERKRIYAYNMEK